MKRLLLSLFVCTQAFAPSPFTRGGQGPSGEQASSGKPAPMSAAQALEMGDKLWALQETVEKTLIDTFHDKQDLQIVLAVVTKNTIPKELLKLIVSYSNHMPALRTLLSAAYYKATALPNAASAVASIPQWQAAIMPRLRDTNIRAEKSTDDIIERFHHTRFEAAPTSTQPMRMACTYDYCPGYVDFIAPWMGPQDHHVLKQHKPIDQIDLRRIGLLRAYGSDAPPDAEHIYSYLMCHFHLYLMKKKKDDNLNPLSQNMARWLYELMQNAYPFKSWYRQILVKATGCSNPTATQAPLGGAPKTGSAAL